MIAVAAPLGGAAAVAVTLAALHGAAVWAWLLASAPLPDAVDAAICALPALLALALAATSQRDRAQYVARLVAAAALPPLLLLMWSAERADPVAGAWRFYVVAVVAHALTFVAALVALAATAARLTPAPGTPHATAATLRRRLQSLGDLGLPLRVVAAAPPNTVDIDHCFASDVRRAHRVRLDIDATRREVRVFERLGIYADMPRNAAEASMRGALEPAFDAARPHARRVCGRSVQATLVDLQRLTALRLAFDGDRVLAPREAAADPGAMLRLVCAVVVGSGFAWCPRLVGWPPRKVVAGDDAPGRVAV